MTNGYDAHLGWAAHITALFPDDPGELADAERRIIARLQRESLAAMPVPRAPAGPGPSPEEPVASMIEAHLLHLLRLLDARAELDPYRALARGELGRACDFILRHERAPQQLARFAVDATAVAGARVFGALLWRMGGGHEAGAPWWWRYAGSAGDTQGALLMAAHHAARGEAELARRWQVWARQNQDQRERAPQSPCRCRSRPEQPDALLAAVTPAVRPADPGGDGEHGEVYRLDLDPAALLAL